jgi:selenoprotein W-related protein
VLSQWGPIIKSVELLPSSKGRFEVTLDGEVVFSKATLGRHANPGEVASALRERIGPPLLGNG